MKCFEAVFFPVGSIKYSAEGGKELIIKIDEIFFLEIPSFFVHVATYLGLFKLNSSLSFFFLRFLDVFSKKGAFNFEVLIFWQRLLYHRSRT